MYEISPKKVGTNTSFNTKCSLANGFTIMQLKLQKCEMKKIQNVHWISFKFLQNLTNEILKEISLVSGGGIRCLKILFLLFLFHRWIQPICSQTGEECQRKQSIQGSTSPNSDDALPCCPLHLLAAGVRSASPCLSGKMFTVSVWESWVRGKSEGMKKQEGKSSRVFFKLYVFQSSTCKWVSLDSCFF